jgi:hypothetical protein
VLDPADLTRLNAAAFGDLFLRQAESFTGLPQILPEIAHAEDRPACGGEAPCKILQVAVTFRSILDYWWKMDRGRSQIARDWSAETGPVFKALSGP